MLELRHNSLPFSWYHGLMLAGSHLLVSCYGISLANKRDTKCSSCDDGGPRMSQGQNSQWDKRLKNFTINLWLTCGLPREIFLLCSKANISTANNDTSLQCFKSSHEWNSVEWNETHTCKVHTESTRADTGLEPLMFSPWGNICS